MAILDILAEAVDFLAEVDALAAAAVPGVSRQRGILRMRY